MGAFCSTSSDSHRKSSRVRSDKYKSDGVGPQPPDLVESTKNQTKFSPPKARKSTEKKSDRPSEIKKSVSDHEASMTGIGSNNDDFYDGIPRYPRAQSQKYRSTRTKQGSEVSLRLSRAGTLGLEKAVEVLDILGSSMTNLNHNNGFVSGVTIKGNELSILAFEVANTIVKGYSLMESVSNRSIQQLKEVVLSSEGVQHLVSKDMDELLKMVATDKREELKIFAREVIRFGNRCKDPQWHNLDRYFEKHKREPPKQLKDEADSVMQHFMTLVHYTAELYQELNTLDRLELDHQHKNQKENHSNETQRGDGEACRYHPLLNQEITNAFGSTNANTESNGSLSIQQRLGPAGLSLHYANIVQQIDSIVARSSSVPSNAREILYQNLPPNIKSSLRSKLQTFHVKEELTVTEIKAETEKTLHWLAPIATNTSKAHHGFGWVGEWASTRSKANLKQTGVLEITRIETLHYADKVKTEDCLLELLLWLNHLTKQMKVVAKSGGVASPLKSSKQVTSPEKVSSQRSSPMQSLENEGMLRDISNRKRILGLSKSQKLESTKIKLIKHDRLSKSSAPPR